jgi:hypothetical protein
MGTLAGSHISAVESVGYCCQSVRIQTAGRHGAFQTYNIHVGLTVISNA